jgi:uncharacterized RDD family membrane protein YckC
MSAVPLDLDVSEGVEYVGFWRRLAATVIDLGLLLFVVLPLTVWYLGDGWTRAQGLAAFVVNWIAPGALWVGFWYFRGATPGKMAVSARIVDAQTLSAPRLPQLIGRYVGYYVSFFACMIGFLWIARDARKQGWHDKMANTVVIRTRT